MNSPRRIQRSRARGSRLPTGTVVVTRPGKWGNPYRVARGADAWNVDGPEHGDGWTFHTQEEAVHCAVVLFRQALIAGRLPYTVADVRRELAGKDLACWCKPDARWCHADVLLSVAGSRRAGSDPIADEVWS